MQGWRKVLACWNFKGLYKTWVGEGVGMSTCQHVGTLEVYKCETWVGEGVGLLTCWHVGMSACRNVNTLEV